MRDNKIIYMCAVDYDHELMSVKKGTKVYPSAQSLIEEHPEVAECGMVVLELIEIARYADTKDFL